MKKHFWKIFFSHSLPLLFTVIALGGGAVAISSLSAKWSSEREAHNLLLQTQAFYEVIIAEMDSLNLVFSTNPEIIARIRYVLENEKWEWIDANYARLLRSFISAPANARPYIDSIFVYIQNQRDRVLTSQKGFESLHDMTDNAWFDTFIADSGLAEVYAEHGILRRADMTEKHILRIYRTIYDSKPQPIGVIVLNLLEDRLINDVPASFARDGFFFTVRDRGDNVLLSIPRDSGDNAGNANTGGFAHFSLRSSRFDWSYDLYAPKNYLYRLPRLIAFLTIFLSFLVCIPGLLLTYRTYKHDQDFHKMQKEVMEYRALQMQINPHFLFNTLDVINWSAVDLSGGPNAVSQMLLLLSGILKYSIHISENPAVPLEEEIKHTRHYLELQNFRWAGRFSAEWDIDPALSALPVPRLILQPILENSFSHGFIDGRDGEKLVIKIHVYREQSGRHTVIEIKDNGGGIDAATLARLNVKEPSMPDGKAFTGFINTRKRIMLLYKGGAEMSISSEKGQGTLIKIVLPDLAYSFIPDAAIPSTK